MSDCSVIVPVYKNEANVPALLERRGCCCLSCNFGSFAAIREGLRVAEGTWFAVMAADLQARRSLRAITRRSSNST